jgi:hypothetical protein
MLKRKMVRLGDSNIILNALKLKALKIEIQFHAPNYAPKSSALEQIALMKITNRKHISERGDFMKLRFLSA